MHTNTLADWLLGKSTQTEAETLQQEPDGRVEPRRCTALTSRR